MSEAETSNIEFENLIASATHQQLLFNSVYFQLWHLNTVLKAKYDTLQKNYSTLATSIPHVFSIIPNPYSVAVPASAPSTTAQFLLPSTKPDKIKYWRRSDYNVRKTTRGDLTVLNDASGSDSDEEMPRKKKKAKTDNVLGFLEHADGKPFDETTISFVRSTSYKIFQSLLDASLAPANWRDCSLEATNRFRAQMIQAIPDLALGENYWKVDLVGTEVYAQWKRKHLPAGQNVKDDLDDDGSLDERPTLKKTKVQERKANKGKVKEVVLEKRKRVNRSSRKHRHIEDSFDGAQPDTQIILDNTRSPTPPPVEMPAPEPNDAVLPPPPPVEMPAQEPNESDLPSPPPDTSMPHFTESTPEPEREEMVELKNPLSRFYVEPPLELVLPPTCTLPAASTSDSSSKPTPAANTVASTSKDASIKPKGATYFVPTATLTGYNLFGKSFTDDGKKKIPREQVKAEYQKPENKQRWDKIAKERKAEEKNKVEAAAALVESEQKPVKLELYVFDASTRLLRTVPEAHNTPSRNSPRAPAPAHSHSAAATCLPILVFRRLALLLDPIVRGLASKNGKILLLRVNSLSKFFSYVETVGSPPSLVTPLSARLLATHRTQAPSAALQQSTTWSRLPTPRSGASSDTRFHAGQLTSVRALYEKLDVSVTDIEAGTGPRSHGPHAHEYLKKRLRRRAVGHAARDLNGLVFLHVHRVFHRARTACIRHSRGACPHRPLVRVEMGRSMDWGAGAWGTLEDAARSAHRLDPVDVYALVGAHPLLRAPSIPLLHRVTRTCPCGMRQHSTATHQALDACAPAYAALLAHMADPAARANTSTMAGRWDRQCRTSMDSILWGGLGAGRRRGLGFYYQRRRHAGHAPAYVRRPGQTRAGHRRRRQANF
ncbi:hypothetical protein GGX14DRAFT_402961 [Mycena pura]|uniref:Uncharacterized protein n=1 Tax=Mycena pura TaxID=153505 RepID=A0AAD6UWI5_9AGAR|nr:hypothetical protein GGX14DRAFT_402961 [Mycena pura]